MIKNQFTLREWQHYIWLLIRVRVMSLIPLRWLVKLGEIRIRFEAWIENVKRFYYSFRAFWHLFKAGFGITMSSSRGGISWGLYRFWWKNHIINDMADISEIDGHFNTCLRGHREKLK